MQKFMGRFCHIFSTATVSSRNHVCNQHILSTKDITSEELGIDVSAQTESYQVHRAFLLNKFSSSSF